MHECTIYSHFSLIPPFVVGLEDLFQRECFFVASSRSDIARFAGACLYNLTYLDAIVATHVYTHLMHSYNKAANTSDKVDHVKFTHAVGKSKFKSTLITIHILSRMFD